MLCSWRTLSANRNPVLQQQQLGEISDLLLQQELPMPGTLPFLRQLAQA